MPTLTWTGKEDALRAASIVPFRLLEPHTAAKGGIVGDPKAAQDNLLIQGDNLEALKALLPYYAGRINCIFIDPPYNIGKAFDQYDDNLEHSLWLSLLYPRLEILRDLLDSNGSIWITVDDGESHYLKVILDEIFGRSCFVANCIWRSSDNSNNDAKTFSLDHNHVFVYSRNPGWLTNKLDDVGSKREHFKNPDNDPRGPWFDGNPLNSPNPRKNLTYDLIAPNGFHIKPPKNGWRWSPETMAEKMASGEIRFTEDMKGIRRRTYLADMEGLPPSTLFIDLEVTGHNRQAKYEQKLLAVADTLFSTPKPEKLIKYILDIASKPGDLVLDSFLGSGTTAAVAIKMHRRWIGIEMGDHAVTHCLPRLQKVIDGEQGGISEAVSWKGGGGFRFVKLGETVFQPHGSLNPKVSFKALAAHVWWRETGKPLANTPTTPLIGTHEGKAFYLLYNGILGDKRPEAGNVLTPMVLSKLPTSEGQKIIFAEACLIPTRNLERLGIIFRQVPYDLGCLHA